jgi:hypothetical protein
MRLSSIPVSAAGEPVRVTSHAMPDALRDEIIHLHKWADDNLKDTTRDKRIGAATSILLSRTMCPIAFEPIQYKSSRSVTISAHTGAPLQTALLIAVSYAIA